MLTVAEWLVPTLYGLFLALCIYLWWRNHWVYDFRNGVLDDQRFTIAERLTRFRRLPSYDAMLWKLWRFHYDVEQEVTTKG